MKGRIATIIIVFFVMSFGLEANAKDRDGGQSLPKEYTDSVRARYGVTLSVPQEFEVNVFNEATIWSLAGNGKYGNPMWDFFARLTSEDHNCMVLLESITAYNEKRIKAELKNKTGRMCREMSYILEDGESGFNGTASVGDFSEKIIEYGHVKSKRLYGADDAYSYSVPQGKTAFCYIHPSVDEEEPFMQSLFESEYPEMRRFFFIKDGHLTYSLTILLSPEGAKHEKKYVKELRNIVKYDE